MTNPSITYGHGYLNDCDKVDDSTTGTADSGTTTTTVDAERTEATTDHWKGYYIHFTNGPNIGLARLVTAFTPGTDTITHVAFPNAVAVTHTYFLTDWGEYRSNMVDADATLTVDSEDIFKLTAVFDEGATDENVYYEKDITDISSDVYTKAQFRYKTSVASAGAKAKIELVFTSGTQEILAGSYSTTWTSTSVAITAGKTIDKIRVYADDDGTNGTFYVYYDFVLLHEGTFTPPHLAIDGRSGGLYLVFERKVAQISIPGRDGDIIQSLGLKSPEIILRGDVLSGESWGSPDLEYFYYVMRDDPWQWFTSDVINCKVVPTYFGPSQDVGSGATRLWELRLLLYSLSSLGESTWDAKQWFGK